MIVKRNGERYSRSANNTPSVLKEIILGEYVAIARKNGNRVKKRKGLD